jgi:hypothetical protein
MSEMRFRVILYFAAAQADLVNELLSYTNKKQENGYAGRVGQQLQT